LNVAIEDKLTVDASEFHTFMTCSTKNTCRTLQEPCGLYNGRPLWTYRV